MKHKYILAVMVITVVLTIKHIGKILSNADHLISFINKMFLSCFLQLHISALVMSYLQVDHFFFGRQTIRLAMLISNYNHTISHVNCMVSNYNCTIVTKSD
jgi:hypothetical protein